MTNKYNILVLGVSGNVSRGIVSVLRNSGIDMNIVGACITNDSIGQYFVDEYHVSPLASDAKFIPWLINICNNKNIDMVLSGVEENIYAISTHLPELQSKTAAKFLVATPNQLEIGNDKLKTCLWLKNNGCNYPLFADASDKNAVNKLAAMAGFPLIAKPRNGKGSNGIIKVCNQNDILQIPKQNYVVEQMLGDDNSEYTVACYSHKSNNKTEIITMKRKLEHGTTVIAEPVFDNVIYNQALKICEAFRPIGPLNIQLRMHNGRPTCFELNVRFSGTTPMRDLLGFRDVVAALREHLTGQSADDCFDIKQAKVIRYQTEKLIGYSK